MLLRLKNLLIKTETFKYTNTIINVVYIFKQLSDFLGQENGESYTSVWKDIKASSVTVLTADVKQITGACSSSFSLPPYQQISFSYFTYRYVRRIETITSLVNIRNFS